MRVLMAYISSMSDYKVIVSFVFSDVNRVTILAESLLLRFDYAIVWERRHSYDLIA